MTRRKRITTLLYCEGDTEEVCSRFFKSISNKSIDIANGYGGSPLEIVQKAYNNSEGYDMVYVWIDSDRPEFIDATKKAEGFGIKVLQNTPDFESELLRILQPNTKIGSSGKKKYQKIYPNDSLLKEKTYRKFENRIMGKIEKESVFSLLRNLFF